MDLLVMSRRRRLAAAVLGLALVLLGPFAAARMACEIACALDAPPAMTGPVDSAHSPPAGHRPADTPGGGAAPHSATCAVTPIALPVDKRFVDLQLPHGGSGWQTGAVGFPRSQVWPPPEHRPRT